MRRTDREITDMAQIRKILEACKVFRLAMTVHNVPYIVPLNYGYAYDETMEFYFHCAAVGKKISMLQENNVVCFEIDTEHQLIVADVPCRYGFHFTSVIGMGQVSFVTNTAEKIAYLRNIMKHQTGKDFSFTPEQVQPVTVCKVSVSEISAKQR